MIKVLHSVSNMDRAGIETMIMNYYRNIDREKVQFVFLCNKRKPGAYDEEIMRMGGKIYVAPGFSPLKRHKYSALITKILKENPEIKIIHAHNGPLQYFSLKYSKKSGVKIRIAHAHSTKIPFSNRFFDIKVLYKRIIKRKIKKVSNYYWGCGTEAIKFYFGEDVINKKEYELVRNAIDLKKYAFDQEKRKIEREKLNIDNECFVVGHIGRFTTEKNHSFLLKVFKEIIRKNKNSKLLLIGDGYLEDKIKNEAKELEIIDDVIFTGNIQDTYNKYQAMDVFVLPSLFEGLPVVGVEAQANGLNCIFSDRVSKEVNITNNVKFIKLEDDFEKWANVILESKNRDKNVSYKLEQNGYSIITESKKLEKRYIELANNIDKE